MENFTNKQINFDILKERAHNLRWAEVPDGVIPLTAADHDFPCAPEVVEALTDYIKDGYFPYIENRGMERFKEDLAKSFRERKNEPVEAKYVLPIDSAARGMQVIADAFLQPGDECLVFDPVDFLFRTSMSNAGATIKLFPSNLKEDRISLEGLENYITPKTKMIGFCNPHNPTGKVFTAEELTKIADICGRHGVVVFADEVHSDFVHAPNRHQVFAKLSEAAKNMCVTAVNPAKTFNIAGLRTSSVVTMNPELQAQYQAALASCKLGREGFGIAGYVKAFTECDYYADQLLPYIQGNLHYVLDYIHEHFPQIGAYMPEGTFFLWLDCRKLPFKTQAELDRFFVEKVKLGLNPGDTFGVEGERFLRMNVACPRAYCEEAMRRMSAAFAEL